MVKKLIVVFTLIILAIPSGFVVYTMFGDMIFRPKTLTPEERLEKRKQENQKLLEITKNGTNDDIRFIWMYPDNNYSDFISANLNILRETGDAGPGTGYLTGKDFLFSPSPCEEAFRKKGRWDGGRLHDDHADILGEDICAWYMLDKSIVYSLRFLSWKTKTGECAGDCDTYGNETAYIRIKYNKE